MISMVATPIQVSTYRKLRALGFSDAEIAHLFDCPESMLLDALAKAGHH